MSAQGSPDACLVGIDVGSRSARAGVFDLAGNRLADAAQPIDIFEPRPGHAEHASTQIWAAVCAVTRKALEEAGCAAAAVKGIGFDATCSLVAVDAEGKPTTISPDGDPHRDTIVWMDHRAVEEAEAINASGHDVLANVGGIISPEMETPKLFWLKKHMPEALANIDRAFDLPDWLVWRATGDDTRSICSSTCKWTFQPDRGLDASGWDESYFAQLGLSSLGRDGFYPIGNRFLSPGQPVGQGLGAQAASEMGLMAGTPVGASLIDAYAGAVGTFHAGETRYENPLALIAGTSACHIVESNTKSFVPGVWGPYLSVMSEGKWALEAGQSAAGALIDRIIDGHGAASEARDKAKAAGQNVHAFIANRIAEVGDGTPYALTRDLHVLPDFHGNRSPIADPTRKGGIIGLTLGHGVDDLCKQVLATIQALAYGTRAIIDAMRAQGVMVDAITLSGGLAKNPLYISAHADAIGLPVIVPAQTEPVLLGSAMLGGVAGGVFPDLDAAMEAMSGAARTVAPQEGPVRAFHEAKYKVFQKMSADFSDYRALMGGY